MDATDPRDEIAHSIIGFSSLYRAIACPGSVRAHAAYDDTAGPAAAEGTLAHELAAFVIDPQQELSLEEDGYSPEMQDGAGYYSTYIDNLDCHTWWVEQRLYLGKLSDEIFGTADFVGIDDANVLHIVDYKFGFHKVFARKNPQLMAAAIGAMATIRPEGVTQFKVHIVQPRIEDPFSTYEFDIAELRQFAEVLRTVEAEAFGPNPSFHASEGACRYCNHKSNCDEFNALAQRVAQDEFANVALSDRLDLIPVLKLFISHTESEAKTIIEGGGDVPGYEMREGRKSRKWVDDGEAEEMLRSLKIKVSDLKPAKLVSVAQAEKLIKAKGLATGILDEYIDVSTGTPVLAKCK